MACDDNLALALHRVAPAAINGWPTGGMAGLDASLAKDNPLPTTVLALTHECVASHFAK